MARSVLKRSLVDVFSPRGRAALRRLMARDPLLAFDFDGTLAPIVTRPETARLGPGVRATLERLARERDCVLITGRALKDIRPRVRGVRWKSVLGNHGMEAVPPIRDMAPLARRVRRWLPRLAEIVAEHPGVEIENKRYSLSVHYRHARPLAVTARALEEKLTRLPGARVVGGKLVFNVVPKGAPNKGVALRRLAGRARAALFIGDDVTDEDAFAALPARRSFTVIVGKRRPTRARFYVRSQRDVARLLSLILAEGRAFPGP